MWNYFVQKNKLFWQNHFSPLKYESAKLEEGDVAKIDLAVQIDAYRWDYVTSIDSEE